MILNRLAGGTPRTYSARNFFLAVVNSDLLMSLLCRTCVTSTPTVPPSQVLSCTTTRHVEPHLFYKFISLKHLYATYNSKSKVSGPIRTHLCSGNLTSHVTHGNTPHQIHSKPNQGTKGNCRIAYKKYNNT
jgi:hypothetical protein